ncbi:MAG TPA: hypothetical protein GX506_06540 [Firmicutes bacterium]|nr:hypothetical protein [Bacillota bacterium]
MKSGSIILLHNIMIQPGQLDVNGPLTAGRLVAAFKRKRLINALLSQKEGKGRSEANNL